MKYLITTIAALVLVGCSGPPPKDIWEAAKQGDVDAVKQFIVAGEDVNTKDNRGSTSLHDRGRTPLHRAASGGHKEVVELLIAEGADVNAKTDAGFTPLCDAAQFGHKEIAELLIATGADVNAKRGAPLNAAILTKHTEIAELLRKHGAKTTKENSRRWQLNQLPPPLERKMKQLLITIAAVLVVGVGRHRQTS